MMSKFKRKVLNYVNFYKYKKYEKVEISSKNRISNFLDLEIDKEADVVILDDLKVGKNVSIRCRKNSKLYIGKDVFFNNNCVLTCRYNIEIGDDVIIGPNVVIFDHDHDYKSINRKSDFIYGEIYIGKNVWIGANACILKGSKIGDNAVIAAGAVVSGEVPENSVYYEKGKIKKIGDIHE